MGRLAGWVALALAAGYMACAQLLRPAGVSVTETLWAEDGRVFVTDAFGAGAPQDWLSVYAGYVHLLPRMIASAVVQAPLEQIATWIAVSAAVVSSGCVVLLAVGLSPWLPEPWMPVAVVVAVGSLDILATETAANLANLHWFATLGLIGLILLPVRSIAAAVLASGAALVLAGTTVFSILLAPLALLGLGHRWRRGGHRAGARYLPVAVAMSAGAGVQLVTTLREPRGEQPGGDLTAAEVVDTFARLVVVRGTVGLEVPAVWQVAAAVVVVATLVGVALVAHRGLSLERGALVAALVLAAAASFTGSVQLNNGVSDRYAVVPAALLVGSLLVLVAGRGITHRLLVGAVAILLAGLAAADWPVSFPPRGNGPAFDDQLDDAAAQCRSAAEARVDITPPVQWFVTLPCAELGERPQASEGARLVATAPSPTRLTTLESR